MLQGAGRVEGRARRRAEFPGQLGRMRRKQFGDVLDPLHDIGGLLGIGGIMPQMMRIVLDHGAATRGIHDDGLGPPLLQQGPPGVDIGAHLRQGRLLGIEVEIHRAAAARPAGLAHAYAHGVEHAHRGRVDGRHHAGLHAAGRHHDLARVARGIGQQAGRAPRRHFRSQRGGQQRPQGLRQTHGRGEQGRIHAFAQQPAAQAIRPGTRNALVDDLAAQIDEMAVLHA